MNTPEWVLTVGELNGYVQRMLAADPMIHNVRIKGEISNFKRHSSGHWYFTLKDATSAISCAMFRQDNYAVRFFPTDGMQVELLGSAGLYGKTGQYQFYVDGMKQAGQGDLFRRFEELKAKLQAEGLFDPARKRPLPLMPKKIGVVTSPTGAVIHDIVQVARRRNPNVAICLCPARVQGDGAAEEIVRGIAQLCAVAAPDVIIVGRGGGSLEDLWPFNEEKVARAILACPVPVVSAVGHETDFTIADFVADLRAPTPSAAAEITVPDLASLRYNIVNQQNRLRRAASAVYAEKEALLLKGKNRLQAQEPSHRLAAYQGQLDKLTASLSRSPALLDRLASDLAAKVKAMEAASTRLVEQKQKQAELLRTRLTALGPEKVLARGYAMVKKGDKVVSKVGQLAQHDLLQITFSDGSAFARTERVERG